MGLVVCPQTWLTRLTRRRTNRCADADRLLQFAADNKLAMRGHCLFWSKPKYILPWVQQLPADELRKAVDSQIEAAVTRYRGRLIGWDVYNEMLDDRFFESRLGPDIAAHFFRQASKHDPATPLFVNEYNILDSDERTDNYSALIRRLQKHGAQVGGIGIQEHAAERLTGKQALPDPLHPERANMGPFDPAGMIRCLDKLAALGLPIHLTEVTSSTLDPQQRADGLEMIFRLGFSHPRVEAIMLWGFWERRHFLGASAALVDREWKLTPAGARLLNLLERDWRTNLAAQTDATGFLRFRGFHGTYQIGDAPVELLPGQTEATVRQR